MANFAVNPLERFSGGSAAIKRPSEITCFSFDDNHEYRADDSSLKWYYTPKIGTDLKVGFEQFRNLDDTQDEHLDALLRAVMELEQKNQEECEAVIVTWRGMMTKLMTVLYEKFNEFEMNATCFQGTIFIEENGEYKARSRATEASIPRRFPGPSGDMMTYWGYKFEALALIPRPWGEVSRELIEGRPTAPVSNYAQYCSIVKTSIGGIPMVLGGEVDGISGMKPMDPSNPISYIELKTHQTPRSQRLKITFEKKLLKFWAQSFLLGIPRIIVGFRDENGILEDEVKFETAKIPGIVRSGGLVEWNGNVCINFLAAFLQHLQKTVTTDGVWRIRHKLDSPEIEVFKVEENGHGEILSNEFKQWRKALRFRDEGLT
ncbi:MAG: decapping endonuclease targeting mRNA [Bogoriella megaspora]|nr:MAG: decapping endonuclease targeting mRNA [Bogoriella megaspora]